LCEWIDLLFGICQASQDRLNVFMPTLYADVWERGPHEEPGVIETMLSNLGSIPPIIFPEEVPVRKGVAVTRPMLFRTILEIDQPQQAVVVSRPRARHCLFARTGSGEIVQYGMISDSEKARVTKRYDLIIADNSMMILKNRILHVVDFTTGTTATFSDDADPVYRITDLGDSHPRRWQQAGSTSLQLFALDRHSQLFLFDFEREGPVMNFTRFFRLIRCFAVSEEFDRFVCCTEDAFCEVYSLHDRRLVNSQSLDSSIGTHILITEGLGLVLVKTGDCLWLFTVNGLAVKQTEFTIQIDQWIAWRDQGGIDQVACVDEQGRVFVFEAFSPESVRLVGVVDARVVGFAFEPKSQSVVAVTAAASAFFFPVHL
jgi:hypothetical protein